MSTTAPSVLRTKDITAGNSSGINDGACALIIASGQKVPLEENFVIGGDRLKYPGDPKGSPAETINCRCAVIYRTPDFQ